jgi:hypothetical protein
MLLHVLSIPLNGFTKPRSSSITSPQMLSFNSIEWIRFVESSVKDIYVWNTFNSIEWILPREGIFALRRRGVLSIPLNGFMFTYVRQSSSSSISTFNSIEWIP